MEETRELIVGAQRGEKRALERLIRDNQGLVHMCAGRFQGRGYPEEDLFQVGMVGLLKSIERFDLDRDVSFSTYAVPVIVGEIKCFLRGNGPVKVSRAIRENGLKVKRAREGLEQRLGRPAHISEIAAECGLRTEDVVVAMGAGQTVESLDDLCTREVGGPDPEKDRLLDRMLIRQLLEELSPGERELIRLRYFRDLTQSQTARVLSMTQVQVSRMEKKILLRMRKSAE